ncbi:ArsR family transcriptional regulator [Halobacteriales archaeon QS_8_69_26]|nr:MAG: ArsR family transcriptional regulator [Halobacteriales archaeon QS_8_69_26]
MADDLRKQLEWVGDRFDLNEYELDAYLAVLEHGRLTASEIADHTDIPQPRVYDTVRSLGDRGLVELRESRPMSVVAIDPEEAFEDVQSTLSEVVEALDALYTTPARDTEAVSLVRSRPSILRHFEDVVDRAEFELTLSVTPDLLTRFETALSAARDEGVAIELLVAPARRAPDPDEFDYSRVCTEARTRRGITTPVVAVADGEHSVYATQDALRDDQDRYGVVFNRSALGFLVSGFFGTLLWTTPQETLYAEDGRSPMPRRYASIRRCVKDLANRDGDLYATVEGRDVENGSTRVVRGEVLTVEYDDTEQVASFTVQGEEGPVSVGGLVASLEDIEAHEIRIGRDEPPELDR